MAALDRKLEWDETDDLGGGHRQGAGHGRRAEGRQRPPRHGHEPGAGGVPALPEGDAPRPVRPALAGPRPVRAVVRPLERDALHPALPRRLGPGAGGPQVAAHLGQQDARATRSTATPPASRPPPARSARASATPSAWRWPPAASTACSTPTPPLGESPFDHFVYAMASDGDLEEGVSGEASSIAGTQQLGNLILIYDDNQISIEDNTDIAFNEDVAPRYEAYGWHVQTVDWTHGGHGNSRLPGGRARPLRGDPQGPAGHRQAQLHPAPHDHRLAGAQRSRTPSRPTATPSATPRSPRPRRSSASTPTRPSRSRRASSSTPARLVERGQAAQAEWQTAYDAWSRKPSADVDLYERLQTRTLPDRLGRRPADVPRRREGHGHPQGQRRGHQRHRRRDPRAVGRVGRPGRVQQHHHRGRAVVHPEGPLRPGSGRATRSPAGCCTSASASTPWARS